MEQGIKGKVCKAVLISDTTIFLGEGATWNGVTAYLRLIKED